MVDRGPGGGTLVFVFESQEKAEKVLNQINTNVGQTWDYIRYRFLDGKPWFETPYVARKEHWAGLDPADYTLDEFTGDETWVDPYQI